MMEKAKILQLLPYSEPFLFVDEILEVDDNGCEGTYRFRESLPFYRGHFKDNPVTPGVLLTECSAQIGLVCLGIYLLLKEGTTAEKNPVVAMSSSHMEFLRPVSPGERVRVLSEKIYFRFSKLKCRVTMFDAEGRVICKGDIAGMLKVDVDE
jgi:3-hydroxyacyl-[acyl-carrier-protein] dehydratase